MSEIIKGDIEIAFLDKIEIGRAEHPDTHAQMVYLDIKTTQSDVFAYFGNPKGLDDTIEALIRARKEVFGDRP